MIFTMTHTCNSQPGWSEKAALGLSFHKPSRVCVFAAVHCMPIATIRHEQNSAYSSDLDMS